MVNLNDDKMEVIIERACGLDVHKETVAACIMGDGLKKEIRTYSTMTNELLSLKEWLKENRITHVAMESTGVYWKPVFNILEDSFEVFSSQTQDILSMFLVERQMSRIANGFAAC